MHRKRTILLLMLAPIAIIAIVWMLNLGPEIQPVPTQTGKLADGSTVTLKKITYGKKHQCFLDSPGLFQRLVRGLPISYQKKLGFNHPGYQFDSSNGQDTLVLWAYTPFLATGLRMVTLSSNGHEMMQPAFRTANITPGPQGKGLSSWQLKNFPRRQKQFTVRLEEQQARNGTWKSVVEWQLSNPGPKSYPTWTASPLPITREAAGITVALTKLVAYIGINGPNTRVSFQVTSNSLPVPNWVVKEIRFTDATGNELQSPGIKIKSDDGEITYQCYSALDPHESAWKLQVDFETYNYRPQDPSTTNFVPTKLTLDFIASPSKLPLERKPVVSDYVPFRTLLHEDTTSVTNIDDPYSGMR